MIKTSIIVPVYNTAAYLRECFDSIFNQTQKEIEVIAVNDGSMDESLSVLEDIKREHPEMIIYSQENQGLGASRNKGMELATGEFIYFIDSDDCLMDDAMETCYYYAKRCNADVIIFDAETFGDVDCVKDSYDRSQIIEEQKMIMSGEEYAGKYWSNAFYPSACLIYTAASFLKGHDLKFMPGVYYEDTEFHCKMIPLAQSIVYIPRKLYRRRYREGSITTVSFDIRHAKDYLHIIQAIDAQKHDAGMAEVLQEVKFQLLRGLIQKSRDNRKLLENQEFIRAFYELAVKIYGGNIDEINQYRNINVVYQLSSYLEDDLVSDEARRKIQDKWIEIWEKIGERIPLASEDQTVGIYGTGKKTAEFLDAYEKNVGKVEAKMFFLDSNIVSGEKKYRSNDVLNINDIGEMMLNCILIASSRYEQEMYQTVRKLYGEKFKVVCLWSDLYFS